jgi:hypothetical protein
VAWTAPFTAVAGSVLTASQINVFVRDNLNETMPAKAVRPGSIFAVSDQHEIVERTADAFSDNESVEITATSFDDPSTGSPGPSRTVVTGPTALVGYRVNLRVPSVTARVEASYAISGATEREASTTRSLGYSVSNSGSGLQHRIGVVDLATLLTPGENTFTLKYNVSSGTGYAYDRRIWVLPL